MAHRKAFSDCWESDFQVKWRVLDFNMNFISHLPRSGFHVTGVFRHNKAAVCAEPFDSNYFDYAMCNHTKREMIYRQMNHLKNRTINMGIFMIQ